MAKFRCRFSIDEIVYYKLAGSITRVLQVKAITFDNSDSIGLHCRRGDGSILYLREDELMNATDYDEMRGEVIEDFDE